MTRVAALIVLLLGCGSAVEARSASREVSSPRVTAATPTLTDEIYVTDRPADATHGGFRYWADAPRGIIARAPGEGPALVIVSGRSSPGHLTVAGSGAIYWVDYRRGDARCDFVRSAADGSALEVLFDDALGDFSETTCETAIALDDAHVYWLHGGEIRVADAAVSAPARVLTQGERFPNDLAVDATHVYWTSFGADPYEEVLAGRGELRAIPLGGGPIVTLAADLTEPSVLSVDASGATLVERTDAGDVARSYPLPR